jgi:hypothetical protein
MQPECPNEANYDGVVKSLLAWILFISQMSDGRYQKMKPRYLL